MRLRRHSVWLRLGAGPCLPVPLTPVLLSLVVAGEVVFVFVAGSASGSGDVLDDIAVAAVLADAASVTAPLAITAALLKKRPCT